MKIEFTDNQIPKLEDRLTQYYSDVVILAKNQKWGESIQAKLDLLNARCIVDIEHIINNREIEYGVKQ